MKRSFIGMFCNSLSRLNAAEIEMKWNNLMKYKSLKSTYVEMIMHVHVRIYRQRQAIYLAARSPLKSGACGAVERNIYYVRAVLKYLEVSREVWQK